MSTVFNNRLCTGRDILHRNDMADITLELYKEVLEYKTQEINYLTQPIDLASYRNAFNQKAA